MQHEDHWTYASRDPGHHHSPLHLREAVHEQGQSLSTLYQSDNHTQRTYVDQLPTPASHQTPTVEDFPHHCGGKAQLVAQVEEKSQVVKHGAG